MKKYLYSRVVRTLMILLFVCSSLSSKSQNNPWEMIYRLPAAYAFHITDNGNMLIADFIFEFTGGIYVSTDKGENWNKTNVEDFNYTVFFETENYVYAPGAATKIARSADDGLTWEVISYAEAVEDELGENLPYSVCYAITSHDGKLFVGDFSGGGIIYSEDEGNTWNKTDIEPLKYVVDGKECVECIYNLASYNGNLYAFGVYYVFKYIPEENSWEIIRDDSNFMAVSAFYQNKLCTARSVMNNSSTIPFILTLDENETWGELPRPEGTVDLNIRSMYADNDLLFVGMQQTGLYYTSDAGLNWYAINEGIPFNTGTHFTPMFFRTDDEYVYLLAYEPPFSTTKNSGLYRLAKSDLPNYVGIDQTEEAEYVSFNGTHLQFTGKVEQIMICDMNGRNVKVTITDNNVNVDKLHNGIYLYNAIVDGKKISGKFLVK